MKALLDLPLMELLRLWSELEQCYHGKNGYGGDTAEIYAYRLMRNNPLSQHPRAEEEARREDAKQAGMILYDLLHLFARERHCSIKVNGGGLACLKDGFDHRVHVQVKS